MKVIIVGGGGSVGTALSARIDEAGGEAFLIGRTAESLQKVADTYGWGYAIADASDWEQLRTAVEYAIDALGEPTAAVNLAGSILLKPAHLTSHADYMKTINANVTTAFGLVRATANRLVDGGSIVLVSSTAATMGLAMHEAIAASKAAVEGLVRAAAATYAGRPVRINAVAPGLFNSNMSAKIMSNSKAVESSVALHPLGRLGTPDDIAAAIEFLISDQSKWITGQVLNVDGGLGSVKLMAKK